MNGKEKLGTGQEDLSISPRKIRVPGGLIKVTAKFPDGKYGTLLLIPEQDSRPSQNPDSPAES